MAKLKDIEIHILKELAFDPDYFGGVARRIDVREEDCRKLLHRLERDDLLEVNHEGMWKITVKGLRALDEWEAKAKTKKGR